MCCRVTWRGAGRRRGDPRRKVFPGDVRDMVLRARATAGALRNAGAGHDDGWTISACPHRGGAVGIDGRGRIYASWYTEGKQARPDLYFATSDDGRRFGPPRRLHTSATSIPDHARMAVDPEGRAVVVWEDSTAVRRRILLR